MKNLRKCIFRIFSVHVSKSSVYRILKNNNITNKKISHKINPKNVDNITKVKTLLENISCYKSDKIISIDESSFDTHMRPLFGWSKKGTSIKKSIFTPQRHRKTLTLGVSGKKIIGYSLVNGSSNNLIFENFLKEQILPKVKNSVILMDNVSFHHSKNVVNCINSTSNKILYNVPYNPETNPIEFVFSIIKNFVRKTEPSSIINLEKSIIKSFDLVTPKKLKHIFNHSINV
jgi:transposase